METDGRRVTSSDVARAAGLSRTTVSYVLNGDFRRIPEHTRQRVLAAADSLGYKPSAAARLLRGARSRLVLMVSPGLESARDTIGGDIVTRLGQLLAEADLHLVWQLGLPSVGRAATDLAPAVVLVAPTEEEARRSQTCVAGSPFRYSPPSPGWGAFSPHPPAPRSITWPAWVTSGWPSCAPLRRRSIRPPSSASRRSSDARANSVFRPPSCCASTTPARARSPSFARSGLRWIP